MNVLETLVTRIEKAWRFITVEVWDIELSALPARRSLGVKTLRVLHLVFRGFNEDECHMHASALTYSTLMAIVPVLALSLAVARGLGADDAAKNRIRAVVSDWTATFAEQATLHHRQAAPAAHTPSPSPAPPAPPPPPPPPPETSSADTPPTHGTHAGAPVQGDENEEFDPTWLSTRINQMVEEGFEKMENVSLTKLSAVGLVILIWMVITVLGRVEASFNTVWGVASGRSLWRKFTDYLSVLFVLPILAVAATSLPIADFLARFLDDAGASALRSVLGSPLLKNVTVIGMTIMNFTFLIMFMPNTRVRARAGFCGGTVSGLLFILWMWVCAALQVGAARYGKIYGGFAVIPIVLAWVYVSWEIVLLGAEVAFAVQNCATYRMEQGAHRANFQSRLLLVFAVLAEAARAMMQRGGRFDTALYARENRVPVRLLNDVVAELAQLGFLAEIADNKGVFALLRAPDRLPVRELVQAVSTSGVDASRLGLDKVAPGIRRLVDRITRGPDDALGNVTLGDLLEDTQDAPAS